MKFKLKILYLLLFIIIILTSCGSSERERNRERDNLEPQYLSVRPFSYGVAVVWRRDWQVGVIDVHGNEIVPAIMHHIRPFRNGLAQIQTEQDARWGFINTLGEFVIPPMFDGARDFSEGLAAVRRGEMWVNRRGWLWGFVDTTGRMVVDYRFEEVRCFSNGMAAIARRDEHGNLLWGFINTSGEVVIEPQFQWVGDFHEGFAIANMGGSVFIPRPFVGSRLFGTGEHVIGGDFMLIDLWGRSVLDLGAYDAVGHVSEGVLAVNQGRLLSEGGGNRYIINEGVWGFIQLIGVTGE